MYVTETLKRYRTAYKNYFSVMWDMWRGEWETKVILRDGGVCRTEAPLAASYSFLVYGKNNHVRDPDLYDKGVKFIYKRRTVRLEGGGDVYTVFVNEEYNFLRVNNEIVIDIGANVGDSAVYFVLNNARKVIALEPYPYSYNIADRNVKNNELENKITLLNAGYGEDGVIRLDPGFKNSTSSKLKPSDRGIDIKVLSLKTLVDKYNVEKAILKMDCEGGEYNLLKEDNNTLRKFSRIQIEYHYGYETLKKRLEDAGFNVRNTEPYRNRRAANPDMEMGYIFAKLVG